MALLVSFGKPGYLGSLAVLGLGECRVSESVALGGTTTNAAQDGEIALLISTESAATYVAQGLTPDASATTATNATEARQAIPPLALVPMEMKAGEKIAFAALS